jgi:hypothetical protein
MLGEHLRCRHKLQKFQKDMETVKVKTLEFNLNLPNNYEQLSQVFT